MPSTSQRQKIGSERYASGSTMKARNDALALAKTYRPLGYDEAQAKRFIESGRALKLLDYCTNGPDSGVHVDEGLEPFLLTPDECNPGEYLPVAIYDARVNPVEAKSKLCWITLSRGEALLHQDSLVFWK